MSDAVCIQITSQPQGDAPAHVRDCWIGLKLFAPYGLQSNVPVSGILKRGPVGRLIARLKGGPAYGHWDGYLVNAAEAVAQLKQRHPDAAAWWRNNVPALLSDNQGLFFEAACCTDLAPPIPLTTAANADSPPAPNQ